MVHSPLPTQFAPAERAAPEAIRHQAESLSRKPALNEVVNAIPNVLVVLNAQRQIVFANQRLVELLDLPDWKAIASLRPGEALKCVHATETEGGCGTTDFCSACGAVRAILQAQGGAQCVDECRLLTRDGTALDLRVWAAPYEHEGEWFTLFAVTDISDEKRRQVLERTFFHDVLNSAGCLRGLSEVLQEEELPEATRNLTEALADTAQRLVEEIESHRQLMAAERGELTVAELEVSSWHALAEVVNAYAAHDVGEGRVLVIDESAADEPLTTDPALLRRVLGNMLKNALEATPRGGTVTAACSAEADGICYSVHNEASLPREAQLSIFQRSFSTKGAGRGLGTYSMKLFGEHYLGGKVWFTTGENEGTTFYLWLPRRR